MKPRFASVTETGLVYLRFGHPATRLSGGEIQRMKIARGLANTASQSGKGDKLKSILYV